MSFGFKFIEDLVARAGAVIDFDERRGEDGGPRLALTRAGDPSADAGFLRLWAGASPSLVDRMIHVRLRAAPVDTQLLFLFGRSETAMPHLHAQVVEFGADACIFNTDFLPRLDPVEHPDYYTQVFGPLSKPYWRAVNDRDNACSLAPANPAMAAYLSPWSIGVARPTGRAELDRVAPQIHAFFDHYLALGVDLEYAPGDAGELRDRDRRHLEIFFSDRLDPRAWKGVYSILGETAGREIKEILRTSLS
ncbi:MAG: hypothetical protein ACE5G3_03120 [Gammaproteobacteria bacterium]